jgi:hypothetical protein
VSYTLLADGTSERALMPIIRWALNSREVPVDRASWADLSLARPKATSLADRVASALELYPCDLLFVHRDAEGEAPATRLREIRDATDSVTGSAVAVVPVRMTEAWLLQDEAAIRRASGNPNGRTALSLPSPARVESLADPKQVLFDTLLAASELTGRRRERARASLPTMRARVAELIADFRVLEAATAFRSFLGELNDALDALQGKEDSA